MSSASPRFPTVFVSGVGHSGSTLLGSLLNGHPDVTCVGEMARIGHSLAEGRLCSCGAAIPECGFWAPILPLVEGQRSYDWRDLTPATYEEIRRRTGSATLVDLSKTLALRMRRPLLSPWRRSDAGYLWLVRDSRGVMASPHREGKPVAAKLPRHLKWIRYWGRLMRRLGDRGITVFYEDLCTAPRRELERICRWMGLAFDEAMLRPGEAEHHFTHSNQMRYMGRGNEIRLDERWRRDLPPELLARIEQTMRRSRFLRERYLEGDTARLSEAGAS